MDEQQVHYEFAFCWCPQCKYWVSSDMMEYETLDDGTPFRACIDCIEEVPMENREKFIYDPHYDKMQCIFCDSYDTEATSTPNTYQCNSCKDIFIV